jgi:hypothetical protein
MPLRKGVIDGKGEEKSRKAMITCKKVQMENVCAFRSKKMKGGHGELRLS